MQLQAVFFYWAIKRQYKITNYEFKKSEYALSAAEYLLC